MPNASKPAATYIVKVTLDTGVFVVDKRTTAKRGICIHANPLKAKTWKTAQAAAAVAQELGDRYRRIGRAAITQVVEC